MTLAITWSHEDSDWHAANAFAPQFVADLVPRFAKQEAQITQSAVVSNKRLSCVLGHIKEKQATKDAEGPKEARTKSDKRLLLQRIKATG